MTNQERFRIDGVDSSEWSLTYSGHADIVIDWCIEASKAVTMAHVRRRPKRVAKRLRQRCGAASFPRTRARRSPVTVTVCAQVDTGTGWTNIDSSRCSAVLRIDSATIGRRVVVDAPRNGDRFRYMVATSPASTIVVRWIRQRTGPQFDRSSLVTWSVPPCADVGRGQTGA